VDELDRLVRLHAAYDHMNAGDRGDDQKDADAAMREYASAHQLAPDKSEILFWTAVSLANAGKIDQALPILGARVHRHRGRLARDAAKAAKIRRPASACTFGAALELRPA